MTEILLCLHKQIVSYDRAKTEKISDFFELTWLIFAGLVTYVYTCKHAHILQLNMYVCSYVRTCIPLTLWTIETFVSTGLFLSISTGYNYCIHGYVNTHQNIIVFV